MEQRDAIISNFIGEKLWSKEELSDGRPQQWKFKFCDGYYPSLDTMKFSTSWDWLMPVVIKIKEIGYDSTMVICGLHNEVDKMIIHTTTDIISEHTGTSLIDAVYKAVVDFIKWYNKTKSS